MKKLLALLLALACLLGLTACSGGEIGFYAVVDRVEDDVAYATVTEEHAGFLSRRLPEHIMFELDEPEWDVQAGDHISACYLTGTIDGQTVRVVSLDVRE